MTDFKSTQATRAASGADYNYPIDVSGKIRCLCFDFVAAAAGADTDTITLAHLPPGRIRVLPHLSRLWHTDWGTGITIDIGHAAYKTEGYADEAADVDAFADGIDVSTAAGNAVAFGTGEPFDIFSMKGVDLIATVLGGNVAIGNELHGILFYIAE